MTIARLRVTCIDRARRAGRDGMGGSARLVQRRQWAPTLPTTV
jgi:hypothetical protein